MGMQDWITPSRKKSCCLLHRQEGDRLFFFLHPLLPGFHSTHGKGRPLASRCPAVPGMGDEEAFPVGQRTVQNGLISPCFCTLRWCSTLWHHLSTQITFGLMQSWWELLSLDSGWTEEGFHHVLELEVAKGKSQGLKYRRRTEGWRDSQWLLWIIICLVGGSPGVGQGWILNTSGYLEWPKPEI